MRLVIDATVAVHVALAGGGLGPLEGHDLVAPPLLWSESTSVIRELAFRNQIPRAMAPAALEALLSMPVQTAVEFDGWRQAYGLAERLGWAKTYDAEYVALAAVLACPLVTLDARLARGASAAVAVMAPLDVPAA